MKFLENGLKFMKLCGVVMKIFYFEERKEDFFPKIFGIYDDFEIKIYFFIF
jgi:hypothetical protein